MAEQIAIIDCGTNTFHLLIVEHSEDSYKTLHKEKVAVRIGKGGINDGRILPDAIVRAQKTIASFKQTMDTFEIKKTFAFATSAFRNASNGEEVKEEIKNNTSIDIEIISGDQEAELIFHGVNSAMDLGIDPSLIMDIGGGSVEFILCKGDEILWKRSFEIGAQRLLDLFHKNDPISSVDVDHLETYLIDKLSDLIDQIEIYQPQCLIGSSGTFDTLSEIYCIDKGLEVNIEATEIPLTLKAYHDIHKKLLVSNRSERMKIPGMIEMRVDMIVVASCLINFLLQKHRFQDIRVSTYAMKEGVLNTLLTTH